LFRGFTSFSPDFYVTPTKIILIEKSYFDTIKPFVLYFSRIGNTKRMAEALAESTNAPVFGITSSEPLAVTGFDMLIVGTPVEGFSPANETVAFLELLPKTEGKKAILFCTRALWKGRTFGVLKKTL
jgi:flavodoxin